jgi:hypothetical protein
MHYTDVFFLHSLIEVGWYHLSAANVSKGSWRMWVPSCFAYLFTGFIFFVMKQEYRHFLELRMDFLARGSSHVIKQHHYSLLVENIPHELRSEKALFDYFNKLFPGKVHSAAGKVVATKMMYDLLIVTNKLPCLPFQPHSSYPEYKGPRGRESKNNEGVSEIREEHRTLPCQRNSANTYCGQPKD